MRFTLLLFHLLCFIHCRLGVNYAISLPPHIMSRSLFILVELILIDSGVSLQLLKQHQHLKRLAGLKAFFVISLTASAIECFHTEWKHSVWKHYSCYFEKQQLINITLKWNIRFKEDTDQWWEKRGLFWKFGFGTVTKTGNALLRCTFTFNFFVMLNKFFLNVNFDPQIFPYDLFVQNSCKRIWSSEVRSRFYSEVSTASCGKKEGTSICK